MPGTREGQSRMADRIWRWRLIVSDTPEGDMRRLDAEVYDGDEPIDARSPRVRLSGFASGRDRRE